FAPQSETGISLVEMMIALTLMALAVIGTVGLMAANNALFSQNTIERKLMLVAQSMLDDIGMRYASGQNYTALAGLTAANWAELLIDNGLQLQDAALTITDISGFSDYRILSAPEAGRLHIIGGTGLPNAGDIFLLAGQDIHCVVQNAVDEGAYKRIDYGTTCPLHALATNGAGL
ncbi:MAG: hypothetical protein OXT03_05245, partial [Alphaproteobacteria bacterium]|nr:hypothetical protein [Alphaproteobacteria bacterium]